MNNRYLRLGVNIDHVATIRNARGGEHPIRSGPRMQLPRRGPMVSRRIFARIGGT